MFTKAKVLVLLCSDKLGDEFFIKAIESLKVKIVIPLEEIYDATVQVAAISSANDFEILDKIISFDFRVIDKGKQYSKVCNFIRECGNNWDFYIKTRPELLFFDTPNFNILKSSAINGRVRNYTGPDRVTFGSTLGGEGGWNQFHYLVKYNESVTDITMDDQFYIFGKECVDSGAFHNDSNDNEAQHEWYHTEKWNKSNIKFNIISVDVAFIKRSSYCRSGHVNVNLIPALV